MSSQTQPPASMDDWTLVSSQTDYPAAMDDSTMMSSPTESPAWADSNSTGAERAAAIAGVFDCDIGRHTPVQRLKLARVYEMIVNEGWNPTKHYFSLTNDEQHAVKRRILQLAWPLPVDDPNTPLGLFRLTQLLDYHGLKVEDFTTVLTDRAVDAFNDLTGAQWECRIKHQLSLTSEQKERFEQTILESVRESMFETDLAESLGALLMK